MAELKYLSLDGLTQYNALVQEKVDDAVSKKADKKHIHAIGDVTNLQVALDGKASSIHTHTVSQISDLTATATELNHMDGVTSNVQTQLDGKAASSHSHTITAGASDDDVVILTGTNGTNKVTYSASHANSGVTAGTYKSVTVNAKGHVTAGTNPTTISGYGITDAYTKTQVDSIASGKANTSHGNHVPATQTANNVTFLRNDNTWQKVTPANIGAAASSHTHTVANISDLTATATELNYMDGVTSNVQTQLNGKAASSHTHNNLVSRGNIAAETESTRPSVSGLSMSQAYNNGYPQNYGNVLNLKGQGDGQLLIGWSGTSGEHAPVYVRSKRDLSDANWSDWAQMYTTAHKPTPSDIGAAATSHTHNYAGSSSVGGAANSAVKLATARTINGVSFDGTANITISDRKYCMVGSDTASSAGWYKVASQTMSGYGDTNVTFMVTSTYAHYYSGLFQLQIRSDNTSISCKTAKWLTRNGFSADVIRVVVSDMTWTLYVNQLSGRYGRVMFEVISESSINDANSKVTLHSSSAPETTAPTATVTSSDGATVNYANSSGAATKATQDSAGQQINTTYIKGLSVSGKTITYTRGNNTTGTITTQDTNTTYSAATTSAAGLMSAADKTKLDGIATGANKTVVDTALSSTSTNPIRNNAVNTALSGKANASHTHNYAGSSSAGGAANSATKLTTARTIRTNLGSTDTASFDGSANITPGVTGTLPMANGGTGATSLAGILANLGIEDRVVSQGKSGNTYYRKWNSGIMEQWYSIATTSQAINSTYGSIYIGSHTWTFPIAFTDMDVVLCSYFRWGTSASWGSVVGATTTYAELRGHDFFSRATGTTCNIAAYAKGRWK